jgi:hypothetical protein
MNKKNHLTYAYIPVSIFCDMKKVKLMSILIYHLIPIPMPYTHTSTYTHTHIHTYTHTHIHPPTHIYSACIPVSICCDLKKVKLIAPPMISLSHFSNKDSSTVILVETLAPPIYQCMYVCVYVCMYVYMYVCM